MNDSARAAESFDNSLREIPVGESRFPAMFYTGVCRLNLKDYDKAIECFLEAEKDAADEKKCTLYYHLGTCYFCKGSFAESLNFFRKVLDFDNPEDNLTAGISFYTGVCLLKQSDYKEALSFLERVERSGAAGIDMDDVHFYKGQCHNALGEYAKAVEVLARALAERGAKQDGGMIRYQLGMGYQGMGRHREAIENFDAAYGEGGEDSDRAEIKYQAGYSEMELGERSRAKETLRAAVSYKPQRGDIYNLLGKIYMDDGDDSNAERVLK